MKTRTFLETCLAVYTAIIRVDQSGVGQDDETQTTGANHMKTDIDEAAQCNVDGSACTQCALAKGEAHQYSFTDGKAACGKAGGLGCMSWWKMMGGYEDYLKACQFSKFVFATIGANFCPGASQTIDEESCLAAAASIVTETQGRAHLVGGSWKHVPPGCSVQSGGDWATHFNRRSTGNNDGTYSLVCTERDIDTAAQCNVDGSACTQCALAKGEAHQYSFTDGKAACGKAGGLGCMSWWKMMGGYEDYLKACQFSKFVFATIGANFCPGASQTIDEESCLAAAASIVTETQGRAHLVGGSWKHVPPGCSVQSGGDWATHFNRNSTGNNDGTYSLVCAEYEGTMVAMVEGASTDED